jgi:oxygen-dependent protoporphyrinogen oxidase
MPEHVPSAIVVGAGVAGLAAAYELHRQRLPVTVLEARARAGGVVLSEPVDEGFLVDAGPDSLLVQKPEGIALCRELGLGERLLPTLSPRTAYVQRGGRLFALPPGSVLGIPTGMRTFAASRLFTWAGKLRMAGEMFVPPRRDDDDDESVGAFMRRRFGAEAATYLAEPLLAGIHAGDVDRLSMGALFPRLRDAERTDGSVIRAFRRIERARAHRAHESAADDGEGAFRSLPGGLSELVDALLRALPAGTVRLATAVTRVTHDGVSFRVETETGALFTAPAVVLASPAFITARLVGTLSRRLETLCAAIPYASTATVACAFTREEVGHPLDGTGFVVPRVEGSAIMAASWLSSKWAHRAPPGRVLMRAFVGGARDPQALESNDDVLVRRALEALGPMLSLSGRPLWTRVYRWPRANAQHEVGHQARIADIDRVLAEHPGLFVTGSAYRGVGIPDCVADGRATARRLSAWLESPRRQLTS